MKIRHFRKLIQISKPRFVEINRGGVENACRCVQITVKNRQRNALLIVHCVERTGKWEMQEYVERRKMRGKASKSQKMRQKCTHIAEMLCVGGITGDRSENLRACVHFFKKWVASCVHYVILYTDEKPTGGKTTWQSPLNRLRIWPVCSAERWTGRCTTAATSARK